MNEMSDLRKMKGCRSNVEANRLLLILNKVEGGQCITPAFM